MFVVGQHDLAESVRLDNNDVSSTMEIERVEDHVFFAHFIVRWEDVAKSPAFAMTWELPIIDIQAFWHPGTDRDRRLRPDWELGLETSAMHLAPVGCLHNSEGRNRMTFALSDAVVPTQITIGVHEETSVFHCSIRFPAGSITQDSEYRATLRIDSRDIPYYESLRDVESWWAGFPEYTPLAVPDAARQPVYSTWYSFHQHLDSEGLERQAKLAKELGCGTLIIDDGWQTSNNQRGYGYCGDWLLAEEKIPDMKDLVQSIHECGMQVMLWYSVPFVGRQSSSWSSLSDKLLGMAEDLDAGILEPRVPEVRAYLCSTYQKAIETWGMDGLKLDFIDSFISSVGEDSSTVSDRDYESVPEAVVRLLDDTMNCLSGIRPSVMVEFRQKYIGPAMRKYANMLRAGDCPNDAIGNRVRTIDLRLLSGSTAIHSDMLMWNPHEPVACAAQQIIHALFSVPQISVKLDELPHDHFQMVKFWLSFWIKHRELLLDGRLEPHHPELLYPVVESCLGRQRLIAAYHDAVISVHGNEDELIIINGTLRDRLVLDVSSDQGERTVVVRDCLGVGIDTFTYRVAAGLHDVKVPPSGSVVLSRNA